MGQPSMIRSLLIQNWVQDVLDGDLPEIETAASDASVRCYWRVRQEDGSSWVVMDADPRQFDCGPFLTVQARLAAEGVPVPDVIAVNREAGLVLLEDLGTTELTPLLNQDSAKQWYGQATDILVKMQKQVPADGLPVYDAAFLRRELELCHEWYFNRQLGKTLTPEQQGHWAAVCDHIVACNLEQSTCFVHRDFHSRNLMIKEGQLRLIDFQDAVCGPLTYDLVSLLRDAYIDWDEPVVLDLAIGYWEKARLAGLPVAADFSDFYRAFEWQGLQRHLKVLGIFARLKLRDGKDRYQADMPRVLQYVTRVCERYHELAPLRRLLRQLHEETVVTGFTF